MNKPLPVPPKQDDLVQSFDALSLAGKKAVQKKLPAPPAPIAEPDHQNTFVGGFSPELLAVNAVLDSHRRPPLAQLLPAVNRNARTRPAKPLEAKTPEKLPLPIPMPVPQSRGVSLTMQYALKSTGPDTPMKPALSPSSIPASLRPQSVPVMPPRTTTKPPLSAVQDHSQPPLNVTPSRHRSISVPLPPIPSSPGGNTKRCNGITKAGKQCCRQVKLPPTHSHLDPTPVLYCHQHKEGMITAQNGFYIRNAGNADKFVEFSHYIPKYLQMDTQLALRVEMEKATSPADVPGYIYTFEIRDPKRPDVIQLKVGRAVNLNKRLDQWDKQCGSKVQIPRGWWPGTVEAGDDGAGVSLLKGNIKAGDPGPFCHRVERLVHIELADLSMHAPYLSPSWLDSNFDPTASVSKKTVAKETTCFDCGVVHREIFSFRRPGMGRYNGKEWDLIVKPVIEKWGRFVKEYYS